MTLFVYSIWIHQLDENNYYAYSPQFPLQFSIAPDIFTAYLRLCDILISVIYRRLSANEAIPDSETFMNIPQELWCGLRSPLVHLMPVEIVDGVINSQNERLTYIAKVNNQLAMPIEKIRLLNDIDKYYSTHPEYIGYNLPALDYLRSDELGKNIEDILSGFPQSYKIGSEIEGRTNSLSLLDFVCVKSFEMLKSCLCHYSLITILNYYLPQYETVIFFYGRESFEWKNSGYDFEIVSEFYKEYFAHKRTNRALVSKALGFIISYSVAENLDGNLTDISLDDYDKIMRLAYIYVHTSDVKQRVRSINLITSVKIISDGFAEIEPDFHEDWFRNYTAAQIDDELEIINESTFPVWDIDDDTEDEKCLRAIRENKYNIIDNELDEAFLDEFGISFNNIKMLDSILSHVLPCPSNSKIVIEKTVLYSNIQKICPSWSDESIERLIDFFTLPKRNGWFDVPDGFDRNSDLDPNNPFSEFGLFRRPIIHILNKDGIEYFIWGLRQRSLSFQYFLSRLKDGKFPAKKIKLKKWISKVQDYNGTIFRDAVYRLFKYYLSKERYSIEVLSVDLNNIYKDFGMLGDIDIAIIDKIDNILYSIECKNITRPRKTSDIRNEFDRFGIIDGKNDYYNKHSSRHVAMCDRPDLIQERLNLQVPPKIISLIITNGVTMAEYTGAAKIPIYSIKDLLRKEDILNKSAHHPFNFKEV